MSGGGHLPADISTGEVPDGPAGDDGGAACEGGRGVYGASCAVGGGGLRRGECGGGVRARRARSRTGWPSRTCRWACRTWGRGVTSGELPVPTEHWRRCAPHAVGPARERALRKISSPGGTAGSCCRPIPDLRQQFNAVIWRCRTGSPWRRPARRRVRALVHGLRLSHPRRHRACPR
ncbi:transposase [Nonomuraea sp. MG754425]|nr:transposase [Nonomuraea sp. MG754425]